MEHKINSFKRVTLINFNSDEVENIIPYNGQWLNVQTDKFYSLLTNAIKDAADRGFHLTEIRGYDRD